VKPSRVLLALAVSALLVPLVGVGSGASAAAEGPSLSVLPQQAAPGDEIAVRLVGWPTGVVTGSICGNEARRDSEDCDLAGSQSVAVGGPSPTAFALKVSVPPSTCPCVVRVTTTGGDVVRTAPLEIAGAPVGPVIGPAVVAAESSDPVPLVVRARVSTEGARFPESWYGPLGGPARRTLVLRIANRSTATLTGLRFVASAGHGRGSASPVASRRLAPIAAGAERVVRIPLDLAAPAFGDYVVFGSVYGLDAPVAFSAKASNEPWGLELLLPLLLLVFAQIARRNERARARMPLQQSSSGVEGLYSDRSSANGWIPRDAGPAVEEYAYAAAAPSRSLSA
jgi:hypothetical protein